MHNGVNNKKSHTTFLIPYTDTILNIYVTKKYEANDNRLLKELVQSIENLRSVYGNIVNVYHIFHWQRDSQTKKPTKEMNPTNFLLIITKRQDGVLVGHRHHLSKSGMYGISELNIDDVAVFNSPFSYQDKSVLGVAVRHTFRLNQSGSMGTLMQLMKDLAGAEQQMLQQHKEVNYGLISEVFFPDDEAKEDFEEESELTLEGEDE